MQERIGEVLGQLADAGVGFDLLLVQTLFFLDIVYLFLQIAGAPGNLLLSDS